MRLHTIPTDGAYLEPIRVTGGTISQRVLRRPEDAPASFPHLPLEHGALPHITRYLQVRDEAGSSPLNSYFLRVHGLDPFPILNPASSPRAVV